MKRLLVFLLIMVFPVFGMAATIHVPGDQPTIQAGIDAALDGDTVLVAPGTYVENIDFLGKAITVVSEQGPDVTIIDGGSPPDPDVGSVVTFESGEGLDSILEGFTVTNGTGSLFPGQGYNGGGIFTHFSSPTITGNIITGNLLLYDYSHGGGIFINNASPTVTGNTISGNQAAAGGGIDFQFNCFSIVADNLINRNTGTYFGGGITVSYDCDPVIRNNDISDNVSNSPTGYGGGGILVAGNCSPTITGNTIRGNSTFNCGGGIDIREDSHPVISDNSITGNTAALWGGGLYCLGASGIQAPTVTNNIFTGNSADGGGGAISCNVFDSMILSNNTITGNSSITYGGGIECWQASLTILNTIFWNNIAPTGTGPEIWVGGSPSELTISYSNVEGGMDSAYVEAGSTLNWGGGMIDEDPQFVTGPDGDYYLCQDPCQPGVDNPCVNTGHPFSPLIEGTTRTDCHPDEGILDMGYHYPLPDAPLDTVTADLGCVPGSGVLPFTSQFSVTLSNVVEYHRTIAGRINVILAGGASYQNWRAGYTNLGPNETFVTAWMQTLPALASLAGANVFELHAEDVTPSPYNQPPYPAAGDVDTATCTVTGIAP